MNKTEAQKAPHEVRNGESSAVREKKITGAGGEDSEKDTLSGICGSYPS